MTKLTNYMNNDDFIAARFEKRLEENLSNTRINWA